MKALWLTMLLSLPHFQAQAAIKSSEEMRAERMIQEKFGTLTFRQNVTNFTDGTPVVICSTKDRAWLSANVDQCLHVKNEPRCAISYKQNDSNMARQKYVYQDSEIIGISFLREYFPGEHQLTSVAGYRVFFRQDGGNSRPADMVVTCLSRAPLGIGGITTGMARDILKRLFVTEGLHP